MLLNEFGFSRPTKTLDKINKILSESYGVSVKNMDTETALKVKKSLLETLDRLKRENLSPRDPAFSKTLTMIGALDSIMEAEHHERPHNVYRKVVSHLYDTAVNLINIGDEIDEAVNTVMKEYRSSPYRFPDSEIEFDLRKRLSEYVGSMEESINAGSIAGAVVPLMQEDDLDNITDDELDPHANDIEYWLCDDCFHGVVNDDYTAIDDEERYQEVLSCVHNLPALSLGDEHDDLSITRCGCCGDSSIGSRHQMWDLNSTNSGM